MKYFKRFKQSYKTVLRNKAHSTGEHSFKCMASIGLGRPFEWINNYRGGWLWMDEQTNHVVEVVK